MYSHKRKSSVDRRHIFKESYSWREKGFCTVHREIHDFLELQADHAAQGEHAALSKLSEAEYHTRLLLEEHKKQLF